MRPFRGLLDCARLCKIGVSSVAAGSAAAAFLIRSPMPTAEALLVWAAVFVLACGACALNEFQDRASDARMERTRQRPLPSGAVRPAAALILASGLLAAGSAMLAAGGLPAVLLGVAAVVWYNGVYAYLKRTSAFAAVPGALAGVLAPAIGWVWAGGSPALAGFWPLGLFFFIWQVPHFWLVVLDRGTEYRKAGLPSLTDHLSPDQIRRVVSLWVMASAACSALLAVPGSGGPEVTGPVILVAATWLAVRAIGFRAALWRPAAALFREMNLFLTAVMTLLCLGRILEAARL